MALWDKVPLHLPTSAEPQNRYRYPAVGVTTFNDSRSSAPQTNSLRSLGSSRPIPPSSRFSKVSDFRFGNTKLLPADPVLFYPVRSFYEWLGSPHPVTLFRGSFRMALYGTITLFCYLGALLDLMFCPVGASIMLLTDADE